MTSAGFRCFVKIALLFLGWRESGAFVSMRQGVKRRGRGKEKKNKKAMAAHMGSHSTQMDNRWTLHRTATRYLHDARWLPLAYLLTGARGGDRVYVCSSNVCWGACPGYQVGIFSVRTPRVGLGGVLLPMID